LRKTGRICNLRLRWDEVRQAKFIAKVRGISLEDMVERYLKAEHEWEKYEAEQYESNIVLSKKILAKGAQMFGPQWVLKEAEELKAIALKYLPEPQRTDHVTRIEACAQNLGTRKRCSLLPTP